MTIAKNATILRTTNLTGAALAAACDNCTFSECASTAASSSGFVPPLKAAPDLLLHSSAGIHGFAFRIDTKILPASVVNAAAQARADEIEEEQGRKVGRKEMRDIKEAVYLAFLQRAFINTVVVRGWLDSVGQLLVIASPSTGKADEVVGAILEGASVSGTPISLAALQTTGIPAASFGAWVGTGEAPDSFSLDDRAVFSDGNGGKLRASHVSVLHPDVQALSQGRAVTELAMTHADKISFTLTDRLVMKGINLIGIDAINPDQSDMLAEERDDAELVITAGVVREATEAFINAMEGT